ncbi:MAG: hypothetical protein WA749_13535 [Gelidibacter sp.]
MNSQTNSFPYTKSLGNWSYLIIGIAAFTTMFSTKLTTLDASPKTMARTSDLLFGNFSKHNYLLWIIILIAGTVSTFFFLGRNGTTHTDRHHHFIFDCTILCHHQSYAHQQ